MARKTLICFAGLLTFVSLASATQQTVTVQNFSYTPSSVTILPSDTVQWTKAAAAGTHNVHHNGTPSLFGNAISASAWTYSVRFDTIPADTVPPIGAYTYNCQFHGPTMNGTVFVRSLWVSAPAAGVTWAIGDNQTISWSSGNVTGNVSIELNRDFPGGPWETLFANTANDGSEAWTVTGPVSANARIRVSSLSFPTVVDVSCCDLTLVTPSITVTQPNGGEDWTVGDNHTLTWTSQSITGNVSIDINRDFDNGGTWESLFASTVNDGTEDWIATDPSSTSCRIRVTSINQPAVADTSDASFSISTAGSATVFSPNGGEVWYVGEQHGLQWFVTLPGAVSVELNRSYPAEVWETLFASTDNDGFEPWTVSGAASTTCRIRVTSLDNGAITDISDADFAIAAFEAPQGLTAISSGADVILSWQPVVGATTYSVYKSLTSAESGFEFLNSLVETTWTDVGAANSQTKAFYRIQADRDIELTSGQANNQR